MKDPLLLYNAQSAGDDAGGAAPASKVTDLPQARFPCLPHGKDALLKFRQYK